MCCGRTRPDHRDMRQRGKVMDGKPAAVDVRSKLAISDAGADSNCLGRSVQLDLVERLQRYLLYFTVGNAIEGVTCPQRLEMRDTAHAVPNIFDGLSNVEILSTEGVISSPIGAGVPSRLGRTELGEQSAGKQCPRALE